MPNIIQLLPDSIASKIAAGEVIQRPASVFKELVENAIDAQSSKISILIKEGGKQYLQVNDNGTGMSPEDARMCFEKHATSKIKSDEDLFNIHTKGFRGEALASIATVARVELKTKTPNAELGTRIVIEDNKVLINEPCVCPKGTSITVQNLFFNLPARKNFLKDDAIELKYILDEFERLAIPHFDIHFILTHNEKQLYNLPATNHLFSRIQYFLDASSREKFIAITDSSPAFELKAYIGNPDIASKKRKHQMIFINQRFVKNNYLNHAIYEAFKGLIPPDAHPQFFLFFNIHPSRIDWNIHPAKIEVRLLDEKMIYSFLISVIKRGLGISGISQTIDFSTAPDIDIRNIDSKKTAPPPFIKTDPFYSPYNKKQTNDEKLSRTEWSEYYKIFQSNIPVHHPEEQSSIEVKNNINPAIECFQWLNKYIICSINEHLYIIDQHRAHEKIIYEKIKQSSAEHSSQMLLFPIHIEVSINNFMLMKELLPVFQETGFLIEEFGTQSFIINGHPSFISANEINIIIENTLENFRLNQIAEIKSIKENFYCALAKSSAIKYGHILSKPEMLKILEDLFKLNDFTYSPSGKKIIRQYGREEISAYFKK